MRILLVIVGVLAACGPVAEGKDPAENAADNYIAAAAIYKSVAGAEEDAVRVMENGWVGNHPEIEDALLDNADAFTELREGIGKRYCSMPTVEGFDTLLPYLSPLRGMARLMLAEGRFYESKQDYPKAYQNFTDVVKLGQDLAKNGVLIHYLVHVAVEGMALKVIRETLKAPGAGAEVYEAAARRLEALEANEVPPAQALRCEFDCCITGIRKFILLSYVRLVDRMRAASLLCPPFSVLSAPLAGIAAAAGGVRQGRDVASQLGIPGLWLMCPPNADAAILDLKKYAEAAIRRAELPYSEAVKVRLIMPADPISQLIVPAVSAVEGRALAHRVDMAATRAMVSLTGYKRRNGRYPATLDQAANASPLDPFSGMPLQYRPVGDGFILYSMGPDMADDNGERECPQRLDEQSKGDIVYRLEK
jgi:hypothetical protein